MEYCAEVVYQSGNCGGTDSINFIIEVLEETDQLFWLEFSNTAILNFYISKISDSEFFHILTLRV